MKLPFRFQSEERKVAERAEARNLISSVRDQYIDFDNMRTVTSGALKSLEIENPRTVTKKLKRYIQAYAQYREECRMNPFADLNGPLPPSDPFNPALRLNFWDYTVVAAQTIGSLALTFGLCGACMYGCSKLVGGCDNQRQPEANRLEYITHENR